MSTSITDETRTFNVLKRGESIVVSSGYSSAKTFPFQMMRRPTVKNSRSKRKGAILIISELSKGAQKLLALIDESRALNDWFAVIDAPTSRSETTLRSRAFIELRKAKLVKRGRKLHTYMLSPDFVVPCGDDLEGWLKVWNSLEPKEEVLFPPHNWNKPK